MNVSVPCGDFFLSEAPQRPVVFISAGVGVTPLFAMLQSLVAKDTKYEIHIGVNNKYWLRDTIISVYKSVLVA